MNLQDLPTDLNPTALPRHIAVIMDGNGRWAQNRGLPRVVGHRQGAKTLKALLRCCKDWGIKTLTTYAFSTENWRRPDSEVTFLMRLFERLLRQELAEMQREEVRLRFLGDLNPLPVTLQALIKESTAATAANRAVNFNVAMNYGSRAELTAVMRQLADRVAEGLIQPEEVDEALISRHLATFDCGDPDLLIRTSGEQRLSNYLLWQLAYTELYFTDVLWPDFDRAAFHQALQFFQKRDRRYGGLNPAVVITA